MKNCKSLILSLVFAVCAAFSGYALDLPVKIIGGKPYYYYTVDKKDRFYELPGKIGVPRSVLIGHNPATNDGLQPGMVITIPVEYDAVIVNGYYCAEHKAKSGESIYGISKKFGNIPVDNIIKFNPEATKGVNGLNLLIPLVQAPAQDVAVNDGNAGNDGKTGNIDNGDLNVIVPGTEKDTDPVPPFPEENDLPIDSIVSTPDESGSEEDPAFIMSDSKRHTVTLLLPFALSQTEPTKASRLITEFYRGFIMGAEKFSHSGSPVRINALDSEIGEIEMESIMSDSAITDADIIITPDSEDILKMISASGTKAKVFNPFVVKNRDYLTNPAIIQAIIPHERMYEKAVEAFLREYEGKTPVFLSRIQGEADKAPFINILKERLAADSVEFRDIAYRDFLTVENLEELSLENQYVFIPASGSRIEFNKFTPALKSWKERGAVLTVFGFPEWITFRAETLKSLGDLGATIYTRFNSVENDAATKDIEKEYTRWYGQQMMDAVPNQGVFGYDIASFVIRNLRMASEGEAISVEPFQGVQSGFVFIPAGDEGGLVNDNLYLLTFNPDGTVRKQVL